MSKKTDRIEMMEAQIEYLQAQEMVKDRLLIEFLTVITAQKITLPKHITHIFETLYSGKLAILKQIDEVIENDEQNRKATEEKERPALTLCATENKEP